METVIKFIKELNRNNNREWFAENKEFYNKAKEEFDFVVNILISKVKEFDQSVDVMSAKECTFRIYKDVRFSKDKLPYKDHFGAYICKGGRKSIYAGYYLHIQENNSFVGGGLYCPQSDILKSVRTDIVENSNFYKEIINDKDFTKYFDEIHGEKLSSAPRGFPKDFKDIELLKFKSHTAFHKITDSDLIKPDFIQKTVDIFESMVSFNTYFNDIISNQNKL